MIALVVVACAYALLQLSACFSRRARAIVARLHQAPMRWSGDVGADIERTWL